MEKSIKQHALMGGWASPSIVNFGFDVANCGIAETLLKSEASIQKHPQTDCAYAEDDHGFIDLGSLEIRKLAPSNSAKGGASAL